MSKEATILDIKYKDHTIQNAITDISVDKIPVDAINVHSQPIRNLSVTIQVLDEYTEKVIETITGKVVGGSVNVSSTSLIRRTGNIKVLYDDDLFPAPNSLIWFNRIIRIYVGLDDMSSVNKTYNFLLGTFWISEGALKLDTQESIIELELEDKMSKYEGVELENILKLEPETPIDKAMRMVMEDMGETKFGTMHEGSSTEVVPYTLEFAAGTQKLDVIEKLRDMYMDFVCGYNVMGEFCFEKIEVQKATQYQKPKWEFNNVNMGRADLIMEYSEPYRLKDVKNRVVVIGAMSEKTGITPMGEVRITDSKNPFNIDAIGTRTKVIVENTYAMDEQCRSRAKFEVWKTSNFQEKLSIKTVPIYILDANDFILVTNPMTNVTSMYRVDDFQIDLSIEGAMSISAHKLYYTGLEYGEAFLPLVDAFMKGINDCGWLSLGEERIKECFGLSGSGEATIIVRFVDHELGGEQASITSYGTTKNQTLQIDLADFQELNMDDENGSAKNRSVADYADRVLGHEMFHAVTNDYYGHDAIIQFPLWFKEGFAEFLHGGKDRFASVYPTLSQSKKRDALIELARKQLNDEWESTSEDYVAAYLIAIAIYNLSGDKWNNLFINMRNVKNPSINFLYKLLPMGETNNDAKDRVIEEIKNMSDVWKWLFDKDDVDTGSIGGIHFMNLYGVPLTAETVFNNANATVDSIGFKIKKD